MNVQNEEEYAQRRFMEHKIKMDKFLGDSTNQKGVIKKALYEQLQEKDVLAE